MRYFLTVGCALGLLLLPVPSLQAFGIRHHHRGVVVAPGVSYYPATGVSSISTFSPSFVQPSTISSYGCSGGMGGSSISFVPMTGLSFAPSANFSTSSYGCFGGAGGSGTSGVQPSAFNATVLIEGLRLLKEVLGARNVTTEDGTSGQVANQIRKINTRLDDIEATLDGLLKRNPGQKPRPRGNLDKRKSENGFGPASLSAVGEDQGVDPFDAAVYAVNQARQAARSAKKAYEAAVEARDAQATQVHHQAAVLKALKKHLTDLGEKVD